MHPLKIVFFVIGAVSAIPGLPLLGFGLLGIAGILADTSLQENRKMGMGFLTYAAPFNIVSILSYLLALCFPSKKDE